MRRLLPLLFLLPGLVSAQGFAAFISPPRFEVRANAGQVLRQVLEMRWRTWMTKHYLDRWLGNKAFYHLELKRFAKGSDTPPDNPDQRIADDLNMFTSSTLGLSMGLLNAVVTLVSFVGILWTLSGSFSFDFQGGSYTIPGFMVWMAVLYCAIGSVLAHYIGRPQIQLNFQQQRVEAQVLQVVGLAVAGLAGAVHAVQQRLAGEFDLPPGQATNPNTLKQHLLAQVDALESAVAQLERDLEQLQEPAALKRWLNQQRDTPHRVRADRDPDDFF